MEVLSNIDRIKELISEQLPSKQNQSGLPQKQPDNQQQEPVTQPKKGDPAVLKLQQDLVNKGYFLGTSGPNKDGVDGVYGLKTKNAEEAFKKGIDYKTYNAQFFQSSDTNKGNTTQGPDINKKVNLGPGKTMTNTAGTQGGTPSGTQGGTPSGTQGSTPQKGRVIKTINPNDW